MSSIRTDGDPSPRAAYPFARRDISCTKYLMPSPFREEHDQFRNTVRSFVQKELEPFAE